ncbi:MBG domain-containing protein, partial [Myroides sp. N17-2]|uniref:MBG domain-containing protein n=1 Tax=Myroides sp. N17-2 TaxID=2030799 RepID=UPI00117E1815
KYKSLTIKGDIPKGVTLKYENNTHSEVGNYAVKATLDGSTNYTPMPYVMTATLSINEKAVVLPSIENVVFDHKTEAYTAEVITIEATNLPNEVRVTYDKNDYINAGVYQITASFYYKDILLGTKSATLTIEKARITTVKFSKKEVTYDGTSHELILEGELPEGVTAVYKNNVHTNAGEHKVSVTLTGDNYVTSTRSNLLVILPADITKLITLESASHIYDGKSKSLTIKGDIPKGVTLKYENNTHSEVGNYAVKATLDGSTNYTPMPYVMTATLSINEKAVVLPSIKNIVFDHKTEAYTAEVITIEATNLPNEVRVTYDKNDYINAGVYQITASFYYKDILLGTKSATLTIEKARITTVKFSKKEVKYDGNSHELLLEGELPEGVTAVYKNNVHTNAGEHKVSVTLTGDNYVTSTRSNLLVILPADITKMVSLETTSFEYDGQAKSLTIKGDVPKGVTLKYENNTHSEVGNYTVKATLDGSTNYTPMPYVMTATLIITEDEEDLLPNLDKVIFKDKAAIYSGIPYKIEATNVPKNVTTKYSENSFVSVGTYSITASFYYKEVLLGTKIATLTVEKARIEDIKFSKKEVVYTGSAYELLIEGELPKGVTAIYKNNMHTNAGEHKASVTLAGDNYVTSTRSNLLIILPADISKLVELRNQSFKYDGKEKSLTIKGSVPTGVSLKYENNTHTELGHYIVKATLDGSPNYTPMPYVMTATLFITQEDTELPSLDKVIFRNRTETYNGNSFKLEATNLPKDVNVEYDRNYYDNAGEYNVTATFFHKTILLGKKTATLTIEKAKLTNITFNRKTVDYNGKPQHILISGKLPKGVSATYENNVHTDAGVYKASVTLEGENYVTSKRTSTFTISPLHISKFISFADRAYVYDGESKTIILTGNLPGGLNVVYENNVHTEIGVYQVKATITGNPNYTPMPYIIVATLVIRNDKERADIEQISINEQVYDMPNNKIIYFLPCGQDTVLLDISELSEGAFVANNIKYKYKMHYSGTITIPIVVKSQTQTLTRNYTIELVRPVPFEKVALKGADNSYEVNLTSSTNGGYNYTAFAWYRNNVLMSNDKYFLAGANGDNTDNANAVYQLILTTDKGETVYSCPTTIEILNTNKIKLYPNPIRATEQLNIVFDFDSNSFTQATIEIYSILGQKVLEAELSNRENSIQLPTGIQVGKYIAVININGQKKTINFIVK